MSESTGALKQELGQLCAWAQRMVRLFLQVSGKDSQAKDPWSGFAIPAERVARSLQEAAPGILDFAGEEELAALRAMRDTWLDSPPPHMVALAEMRTLFKLSPEDVELLVLIAAPAIDPAVHDLYAFVWDNVHKKSPDVGFVCQILARGERRAFADYYGRLSHDAPLRRHRLVEVEERLGPQESLALNLVARRVRVADRVLDFMRYVGTDHTPMDESLASMCSRLRERVDLASLRLPTTSQDAVLQLARSRKLPAIFEGPVGAGKEQTALAFASLLERGLISADLNSFMALPPEQLLTRLADLFREARLGNDVVYLRCTNLPEMVFGPVMQILQQHLVTESVILGVDRMTMWLVTLTTGWPVVPIPLPGPSHRIELWRATFDGDKRCPDDAAIDVIGRRYEMSAAQIRQAASEARRLAQVARHRRVEVADLDKACRTYFAHKLSDLAELVPPSSFKPEQLILPPTEREKFEEIMLYSKEHDTIYNDWGFGERFPYGRGLSVLFYGPPGTGKTMAACIIASVLGLDLFRVDLSRIMSRYVGETEKNLARVFDEAERGRVMLLFDEADALFTKRTQVKSSVDRYANLEVAYLLQRMENFEGVSVLTTNVESHLDDAFKRRIRYRVYFPMPDGPTRGKLFSSLIPAAAPKVDTIPFDLLGEHFEISGGHIKQAVLRAAFYARRAGGLINLEHLYEATVAECRELGMLMSDKLPKALAKALRQERGEPEPPSEEEEQPQVAPEMLGLRPILPDGSRP